MLEVKQKRINASTFGSGDQDMLLAFGRSSSIEDGYTGLVSTKLLGNDFTEGMGTTLNSKEACVGIVIETPSLSVSEDDVNKLVEGGMNLSGAYTMVEVSAYNQVALAVGKALFKGDVEPTIKMHFDDSASTGHRKINKIEMIIKGEPTGHPFWTLDNF